jgi:SAM-dependent methyltransferase
MVQGSEQPLSEGIDVNIPSVARMYDYYLGGKDNYAVDREASEDLLKVVPSTQALALNNRRFLRRVVRRLAEDYGIRQFVDHGSGLPTQDNVHEVAQRVDPASRVVYVDNDPIVLAHGRALLEENDNSVVIQADMRDTDGIFGHPEVTRLIDFDQPVAALFVSVMHCIPDSDDPAGLVRRVADRLAPGSFLVVCQLVRGRRDPQVRDRLHGERHPRELGTGASGARGAAVLRRSGDPRARPGGGLHLAAGLRSRS